MLQQPCCERSAHPPWEDLDALYCGLQGEPQYPTELRSLFSVGTAGSVNVVVIVGSWSGMSVEWSCFIVFYVFLFYFILFERECE